MEKQAEMMLVADLMQLLTVGERPDLALHAAHSLSRLGSAAAEAADAMATLLEDPNPFVRGGAATALGELGQEAKAHVDSIAKLLDDMDGGVRSGAARALGRLGGLLAGRHQAAIASLLRDKDLEVKVAAATALANLKMNLAPEAAGLPRERVWLSGSCRRRGLALLLEDEHHWVREAGFRAVEKLGPQAGNAAESFSNLLTHEDVQVREMALKAMAELGQHAAPFTPNMVPLLIAPPGVEPSQKTQADALPKAAIAALTKLKEHAQPALPDLRRLLQAPEDEPRKTAHKVLNDTGMWNSIPEGERTAFEKWIAEKRGGKK
eukprot:TRINITY_DN22312_c0_g2_i1.p1 TRINITY_DN22312_c0_g2~~TRINITY_DN22312_c0_g2_i1.p1  ORF type:complete len:321 (+),score=79.13 TRINITY_DN22312_c0_g2_i1:84-1046(+)